MNIPIWIKSEYVTYIGNALLSFVWRVGLRFAPVVAKQAPPGLSNPPKERVSRPALWFSMYLYYHLIVSLSIKFWLNLPAIPTSINDMSCDALNAELSKGMDSLKSGKNLYPWWDRCWINERIWNIMNYYLISHSLGRYENILNFYPMRSTNNQ